MGYSVPGSLCDSPFVPSGVPTMYVFPVDVPVCLVIHLLQDTYYSTRIFLINDKGLRVFMEHRCKAFLDYISFSEVKSIRCTSLINDWFILVYI